MSKSPTSTTSIKPNKVKIKIKNPEFREEFNSSVRRKIQKKKIKRAIKRELAYMTEAEKREGLVGLGIDELVDIPLEKELLRRILEKLPKRKNYVRSQCSHRFQSGRRCTLPAVGSGQLCALHGGVRNTKEGLDPLSGALHTLLNKSSKYNPLQHPLDFIKLSQQGYSDVEVAAEFKISLSTLRSWVENYQDFGEAYDIGQTMYESWWLAKGKDGLDDARSFNTPLYKFLTGNKLGYSDKIETKSTNTNTYGVLVVPGVQSLDNWEKNRENKEIKEIKETEQKRIECKESRETLGDK